MDSGESGLRTSSIIFLRSLPWTKASSSAVSGVLSHGIASHLVLIPVPVLLITQSGPFGPPGLSLNFFFHMTILFLRVGVMSTILNLPSERSMHQHE